METRLNTASCQFFQMILLFSFITTLGLHGEGMGPVSKIFCGKEAWLEISWQNHPFQLGTSVD